ncbi:hypothetical protein IGI04_006213 [Brassica rapa subsp. trilocularis]|uniref:Epidermal patterning factor-like protein n=1 Tax=Brassica rapa subsp. trilocularis TaxID=1813537 RepID=A0ABQ7NGB1_BRACM|nr:hypothetical protein IGI04_006213 [Brassica rapa subsp. trilocularis]
MNHVNLTLFHLKNVTLTHSRFFFSISLLVLIVSDWITISSINYILYLKSLLTSDYFVVYFYCEVVDVASGSSIPDCSHACGSCTPCKLVVVSSKCSASESEACPVVYKCLCKGKYYHVPSIA